jgi:uncharacterized protein YbaR (Trm112 family)
MALKVKGRLWPKAALILWFGLCVVLILNKGVPVFPSKGFSLLAFAISVLGGNLVYRKVVARIGRGDLILSGFKKWVVTQGGLVLYPLLIWYPINRGIPILLNGFATIPYSEVVTIGRKEWHLGRRLDCRHEFILKEYSKLVQGKLCIDELTYEKGKAGAPIRLSGRKNLMAFYVDVYELNPNL